MSICRFERVVKVIYSLSGELAQSQRISDTEQLKNVWLEFLDKSYHKDLFSRRCENLLVYDPQEEDRLSEAFSSVPASGNPDQQRGVIGDRYPRLKRDAKLAFVHSSMVNLSAIAPHYAELLELCIHSIIVRDANGRGGPKAHSSSAADAVGIVWLSCIDGISKSDVQELLIHELVHQILFIEDFLYDDFDYERMSLKENFALTAISLTPRPLDIAIHSFIVASELIIARANYLGEPRNPLVHPHSGKIMETMRRSRDSIYAARDAAKLMSPYIEGLIERAFSDALDCSDASLLN